MQNRVSRKTQKYDASLEGKKRRWRDEGGKGRKKGDKEEGRRRGGGAARWRGAAQTASQRLES